MAHSHTQDPKRVRAMFGGIARHYDLLNHLLSANLDRGWRRAAVRQIPARSPGPALDLCCGTGDLAVDLIQQDRASTVICCDFSHAMLTLARDKFARRGIHDRCHVVEADALRLPFADGAFDAVTVGFGIRNVENLEAGLAELRRVLCVGHRLVLLEFTPLANRFLRPFANFYSRVVLPRIGNVISRSSDDAYGYLNDSIGRWHDGESLAQVLESVGFEDVGWRPLFPGNVALHWGQR